MLQAAHGGFAEADRQQLSRLQNAHQRLRRADTQPGIHRRGVERRQYAGNLEAKTLLEFTFQCQTALIARVDLHADHPGLTAFLQQAGNLQPRQPQTLADVILRQAVVVVAPRHPRHQLLLG